MTRIAELARKIPDIAINTAEKAVRTKSRDYFFWSPILKAQLDHVTADAVGSPKNESEVMRTLAACWELDIPVTPRGGGTGNYGQAMPLAGGVVLDMMSLDHVRSIDAGTVVVAPGARLSAIEDLTRPSQGLELRMYPSTGGDRLGRRIPRRRLRRSGLYPLGHASGTRQYPQPASRHHGGGSPLC